METISAFDEHFPNFARMLRTSKYPDFNEIGEPATIEKIAEMEADQEAPLPGSYKQFLRCASAVSRPDGFSIGGGRLFYHERGLCQGMLCFADFWLEGDGDQVLFDVSRGLVDGEYPVYYYNHDTPSVRKLADSFGEFIEKVVATPA